jgi:hypothetical protein
VARTNIRSLEGDEKQHLHSVPPGNHNPPIPALSDRAVWARIELCLRWRMLLESLRYTIRVHLSDGGRR